MLLSYSISEFEGDGQMKLATLKNGTRDGVLVVVSTDLTQCTAVGHIAANLQTALDNWLECGPRLAKVSEMMKIGAEPVQRFHENRAMSPLPRAYQWADGSAYVHHAELMRKGRDNAMPEGFLSQPLMYQGGSDSFLNPRDAIIVENESFDVDMEGEIAVIIDDVAMGATPEEAASAIRLIMLVNDISLRALIPSETSKGFGFFQSKPSSSFSPVAVTPDELGSAWRDGKVHLPLHVNYNGTPFGRAEAGEDMTFDFGQLIAHAAKTRSLSAGTIIGSGTVSNKMNGGYAKPIDQGGVGYSCIAEMRMVETFNDGQPKTEFMKFGDQVRIEMFDDGGKSIFGAIEQTLSKHGETSI